MGISVRALLALWAACALSFSLGGCITREGGGPHGFNPGGGGSYKSKTSLLNPFSGLFGGSANDHFKNDPFFNTPIGPNGPGGFAYPGSRIYPYDPATQRSVADQEKKKEAAMLRALEARKHLPPAGSPQPPPPDRESVKQLNTMFASSFIGGGEEPSAPGGRVSYGVAATIVDPGKPVGSVGTPLGQGDSGRGALPRAGAEAEIDPGARGRGKAEDTDGDGRPDRFTYADPDRPTEIERIEEDTSGDGAIDLWSFYNGGAVVRREGDTNGDGRVDSVSEYREAKLVRHRVDVDADGVMDATYEYRRGELFREERDSDKDGRGDSFTYYELRDPVRVEKDTNGDSRIDEWIYLDGERVVRMEHDTRGDGRPDRWRWMDPENPEQVLREEEDRDGDGKVDVWSYYEDGELVRRETAED